MHQGLLQDPPPLLAGGTGPLGQELLGHLSARGAVQLLVRQLPKAAPRGLRLTAVTGEDPDQWPAGRVRQAIVQFERAQPGEPSARLGPWTPSLGQLPALARWLHRSGTRDLVLVLPHAQGRLPEALKHGLASVDEQAVAQLGFERLLLVRSASRPQAQEGLGPLERLADAMLSIFKYMVPSHEQPVRPATVVQLVMAALALAPRGIHVASPQLLWRAAQGDPDAVVREWLALG